MRRHKTLPPSLWKLLGFIFSTPEVQLQGLWSLEELEGRRVQFAGIVSQRSEQSPPRLLANTINNIICAIICTPVKHRVTDISTPLGPTSSYKCRLQNVNFMKTFFFRLGKDDIVLEIFFAGGGAWFHGVRQLFPAPQHQCDPPSDLPAGNIKHPLYLTSHNPTPYISSHTNLLWPLHNLSSPRHQPSGRKCTTMIRWI